MRPDLLGALRDQSQKQEPFCLATVVKVEGSASARTGSKAIFDAEGRNLFGWIGGGCAERFVAEQSIEALKERRTRTVIADLDDEIFGLGIACGGKMEIFIEPVFPEESISLARGPLSSQAEFLARGFGWRVHWRDEDAANPVASTLAELLLSMARAIAHARGRTARSMRELKDFPATFASSPRLPRALPRVVVLGKGRIVEAVARLASLLGWDLTVYAPGLRADDYPDRIRCECLRESYDELQVHAGEIVLIASHHAHDPEFVERALEQKAAFVGMVGSRKRGLEVLARLGVRSGDRVERPLFIPAGLDLDARSPDEIALSIVAELISLQGPGNGR